MNNLQETVRKIYEESGDIASFGMANTSLPVEWESFFKRRKTGLRKQEPEPEIEEKEPDVLQEILSRIIKRLEAIEVRLDLIEEVAEVEEGIAEEITERQEIRKSTTEVQAGLELATLKGSLAGVSGEFVKRRGFEWVPS